MRPYRYLNISNSAQAGLSSFGRTPPDFAAIHAPMQYDESHGGQTTSWVDFC
jgi:hypothetical protein